MLDQEIPSTRDMAEKREHLLARLRIDAASFRSRASALERLRVSRHVPYSIPIAAGSVPSYTLKNIMRVELLGVPRARAGVAELELRADTLGELLVALAVRFPSLGELITADRLRPSVVANLNGDRFISDPRTQLSEGDSVLILSADAGG
jgi:sulfur-carrier protein